ncbi:MAG: dihydroneopterin aldolase [Candidatus Cloacimonadaceae bacterium]|nr:dihydroneopterin aldolase [Candidatus Cloacimonadaceae bacterium]MDP3115215.1 dihydroneopterin aldolase [Candidatus Cloacimonadaceae bacterium]
MIIHLNEMVFYGFHGVHDEERRLGQRFIVTAHLFTDDAGDRDILHLKDTVDYTKVFEDIKEIMESHQFHILETCANTVADKLLADYPLLTKVRICIQKPSVAIQGSLKSVEVEMTRER